MTIYDHAFTIAFSLRSCCPDGRDVSPGMIRTAILTRLASVGDEELLEAVGAPFDTYADDVERLSTLRS